MLKIKLGKSKSKLSSNENNRIGVELKSQSQLLFSDMIAGDINQYAEYIAEKDASQKYRIYLTVKPYCSNILFNTFTETVYKEGSPDTVYIGVNNQFKTIPPSPFITDKNVVDFNKHTQRDETLSRYELIRDTSYSHSDIGSVVYHCGYDIFNNHMLRKNEFTIVNPLNGSLSKEETVCFNTIRDYLRDKDGNIEQSSNFHINYQRENQYSLIPNTFKAHLYQYDTIDSFDLSITKNLTEIDGWVGFINPVATEVPNYKDISLNKCMNNNKPCEFIDMYPDRSLYSFVPKYNKYLLRYEPNWDVMLCYASGAFYDNNLITHKNCTKTITENGQKKIVSIGDVNAMSFYFPEGINPNKIRVLCKTKVRNTFSKSSSVHIYVIHNDDVVLEFDTLISGLGDDEEHEFYLRTSEIDEILALEELKNNDNGFDFELRIAKIVNGKQCKYYYRVLQPFDIRQNTLNKLGFSKNIYSDDIVQYLYNSPIDTSTIRDHLGRPVTELYATVLKRHKGDYIWYEKKQGVDGWNGTFTQEEVNEIEYNHCFGKLTAGLDLAVELDDYNVHKIHNVPKVKEINKQWKDLDETLKRPESIKLDKSEQDITSDSEKFIGDLVEFNQYSFNETVIEKMYYRFNTKQREMYSKEFDELIIDSISSDDYDQILNNDNTYEENPYNVNESVYNTRSKDGKTVTFPINIFPEGYYYQAHYPIHIREYSDTVKQGQDTRIAFTVHESNGDKHILQLADSYNMHLMDYLVLYRKNDNSKRYGIIIKIDGLAFTVKAKLDEGETMNDYLVYHEESDKPEFALNFDDGSGRYYYRELKSDADISTDSDLYDSMFTNGVHYMYKDINFYLRRQDPTGEYGLSSFTTLAKSQNLVVEGNEKDIQRSITKDQTTSTEC